MERKKILASRKASESIWDLSLRCGVSTTSNQMDRRPTDGRVYIFFNGTRDKVKMLIWDGDGYVIYGKRLERGRFEQIVSKDTSNQYQIAYKHLVMLLSGISLIGLRQKPRYDLAVGG